MLLWACGLTFAGEDEDRQPLQARSKSLCSYWKISTELNQIWIKSWVNTNISSSGCTRLLQRFCCWSPWGTTGCVHRCSWWQMSYHLLALLCDPPCMADPYRWMLQPDQGLFPLSLTQPCSLFMVTHKWSWFLRILSIIPLYNYFLASLYLKVLLQKQLLRSQGLFTGNRECVKWSRCLLLLLLSRGVSQQFCLWLALYQDIR